MIKYTKYYFTTLADTGIEIKSDLIKNRISVIYIRSSSYSSYHNNSKNRQSLICSSFASKYNISILKEFSEVSQSNVSLLERLQFKLMIDYLCSLPIENRNIIVESLSRIGRNYLILKQLQELYLQYGIKVYPLSDLNFINNILDEVVLKTIGHQLIVQKQDIDNNIKFTRLLEEKSNLSKGIITLQGKGKVGGIKSFYETNNKGVDIVKININKPLRFIQEELYKEGIRTKKGSPISKSTIGRTILRLKLNNINKKEYSTKKVLKINIVHTLTTLFCEKYKDTYRFIEKENKWYKYLDGIWIPISHIDLQKTIKDLELTINKKALLNITVYDLVIKTIPLDFKQVFKEWPETDTNLIPFLDGVYNLLTKEIIPLKPEYNFRFKLPYSVLLVINNNNLDMNSIMSFLFFACKNRVDVIYLILSFIYLSITSNTEYQRFLEIIGPGGSGKSTLITLISAIVGKENRVITELKHLEENKFEVAKLVDKKLIVINDSPNYSGDCSMLKQITGGDAIRIEEKHKQQTATFVAKGLVLIAANEDIRTKDLTSGYIRRKIRIDFDKIPETRQFLIKETLSGFEGKFVKEIPSFFNFILNLNPKVIKSVFLDTDKYIPSLKLSQIESLKISNPIAQFISDNIYYCPNIPSAFIPLNDYFLGLYNRYLLYCQYTNNHGISMIRFSKLFEDIVKNVLKWKILKAKASNGMIFYGIGLYNYQKDIVMYYKNHSQISYCFYLNFCQTEESQIHIEEEHSYISNNDFNSKLLKFENSILSKENIIKLDTKKERVETLSLIDLAKKSLEAKEEPVQNNTILFLDTIIEEPAFLFRGFELKLIETEKIKNDNFLNKTIYEISYINKEEDECELSLKLPTGTNIKIKLTLDLEGNTNMVKSM